MTFQLLLKSHLQNAAVRMCTLNVCSFAYISATRQRSQPHHKSVLFQMSHCSVLPLDFARVPDVSAHRSVDLNKGEGKTYVNCTNNHFYTNNMLMIRLQSFESTLLLFYTIRCSFTRTWLRSQLVLGLICIYCLVSAINGITLSKEGYILGLF